MSTRSTLIYSGNTGNHIWEETSEPVYYFDSFRGFNVYGVIDFNELLEVAVKNGGLLLTFIKDTYFHYLFPEGLRLYGGCLIEFTVDEEGVSFGIKGDNETLISKLREAGKTKYLHWPQAPNL